jgi:hypothetical protein
MGEFVDFKPISKDLEALTTEIVVFIEPGVLRPVLTPAVDVTFDQVLYSRDFPHDPTS